MLKRKKNKNLGFTLIELLAVILILGIIALIAIPTVNSVLDEARLGAFESTLNNVSKKVEGTCNMELIKGEDITLNYVIEKGKPSPSLELKGDLPNGTITVNTDCSISYSLSNNKYVATKSEKETEAVIEKKEEVEKPTIPTQPPVSNDDLIAKSTDKTKSYVGYYADVDADGTVDGLIFADLITGAIGDGAWAQYGGGYIMPTISSNASKDYYLADDYTGNFGTKPVVTLANNSTGEDRFYVLALEKIGNVEYKWYYNARGNMTDYKTVTSPNFGTGKQNTANILEKWNNDVYGAKHNKDIWKRISTYVDDGWFIPSRDEWSAFACEILELRGINGSNFDDYGLSDCLWTSSQYSSEDAWGVSFSSEVVTNGNVDSSDANLQLAITF